MASSSSIDDKKMDFIGGDMKKIDVEEKYNHEDDDMGDFEDNLDLKKKEKLEKLEKLDKKEKLDKLDKGLKTKEKEGKLGKEKVIKDGKFRKNKTIKSTEKKPKKKKMKQKTSWVYYIHKVLKTVHEEDCTLSTKAMDILDSFANDVFDRISGEAVKLLRLNNKRTLTSNEIMTAVKLTLPGELQKHAIQDGTKAVKKYQVPGSV